MLFTQPDVPNEPRENLANDLDNQVVAKNATASKIETVGAEVLKNEPESDTIESKAEKTSVEREDNSKSLPLEGKVSALADG